MCLIISSRLWWEFDSVLVMAGRLLSTHVRGFKWGSKIQAPWKWATCGHSITTIHARISKSLLKFARNPKVWSCRWIKYLTSYRSEPLYIPANKSWWKFPTMHSQVTKYARQLCAGYQLPISKINLFLRFRFLLPDIQIKTVLSPVQYIKGYFQSAYEAMHIFMGYSTYLIIDS